MASRVWCLAGQVLLRKEESENVKFFHSLWKDRPWSVKGLAGSPSILLQSTTFDLVMTGLNCSAFMWLQVSLDEAEETLDLWYKDRKEVRAWQDARREEACEKLRVHTLLGRTRNLPDAASSNKSLRSHSLRAAINTPVQVSLPELTFCRPNFFSTVQAFCFCLASQGSAADVAMCAMLEINRNQELRDLGWKLLLQVGFGGCRFVSFTCSLIFLAGSPNSYVRRFMMRSSWKVPQSLRKEPGN